MTAPVAVSNTRDESGGVTASAAGKVTVCQNGKTIQVAQNALNALLAHGATLGACTAGACPCFTQATIASVAATCALPYTLDPRCPSGTYSLELSCVGPGDPGFSFTLGVFEAVAGTNTCSKATLTNGELIPEPSAVDRAQFEACRRAIVSSPSYPASCPR